MSAPEEIDMGKAATTWNSLRKDEEYYEEDDKKKEGTVISEVDSKILLIPTSICQLFLHLVNFRVNKFNIVYHERI